MKLNLNGNSPVLLPRDPQQPMEATTKNYVDNGLLLHTNNQDLHLTPSQNTFLDGITVSVEEVNHVAGLTSNAQIQLNSKLDLAGGTMTGALILSANPTTGLEATTKNYVDARDALKVSKSGDTMTGPLVLSGDPINNLEAAPKQYVDSTLTAHINNQDLHLTGEQNALLDAVTVNAIEINRLAGVSGNVQAQIDTKFDKAGGLITGDVTLEAGRTIYVSKIPLAGSELVNKSYVDALVSGREFRDPVSAINLVSDSLSTPPETPVVGDLYIVGASATDAWTGKEGFATWYNGSNWVFVQNRPVASGDRFLVGGATSTNLSASLVPFEANLVTINSATPGAITYVADSEPSAGTSTLVFDQDAYKFGVTYSFSDEGNWIPTNTSANITAGEGLGLNGNMLNVNVGQGLAINNDTVEAVIDSASGLIFNGGGAIKLALDGASITQSANGIKVSDTVMASVTDAVLKSGSNVVSGSIVISASGVLRTNATATEENDVVNKGYIDAVDTAIDARLVTVEGIVSTLNTDPVTKTYVDTRDATKLDLAGGTMTGNIVLAGDPTQLLHPVTKQYSDTNLANHINNDTVHLTPEQNEFLDAVTITADEINRLSGITSNVQTQLNAKLNLSGGVMTGSLLLAGDPTVATEAVTKQYTDAKDALKVNKAGDTMTGMLTLAADPTDDLHASTKQYSDAGDAAERAFTIAQAALKVNKAGDTMTGFLTLNDAPTDALHAATKQYVDDKDTSLKAYVDAADLAINTHLSAVEATVDSLNADPVTKTYVDTRDATKLNISGGSMTGYITLHADPTQPLHPATKQYVDAGIQGVKVKSAVRVATTTQLNAVYDNGTLGVNATLTASTNGALVIDGITVGTGDRVLVKDQSSKLENGDYVVQQTGDVATPFILKRTVTMDESSEVPGSFFFVEDGDTLEATGWTLTTENPITFAIGVDPINVNQMAGAGTYIGGAGLTITGNTIDINTANSSRIVVNQDNIDLATTGVIPGNYTKVVVDGYGRITTGTNPTTLAGYGIVDGQPLSANLSSLSTVADVGVIVRDSTDSLVAKSIVANGAGITISNGDGGLNGNIVVNSNATSNTTGDALVVRDANGDFAANVITASLNGNASTATTLANSRNIGIIGDATAPNVAFNGSANVQLELTLADTGVVPGTYNKVTVNSKGLLTLGANATTVAEFGIVDAATISYVNDKIAELDAKVNELYNYVMSRI